MTAMKKATVYMIVLVLLLSAAPMTSFAARKQAVSRTMMIYMCGSDLESESACMTAKLNDIKQQNIDLSQTHVIVMAGGSEKWHSLRVQLGECHILELKKGISYYFDIAPERTTSSGVTIHTNAKANMGDPMTLWSFLQYCYETYPADEFDLILMNHGGGPAGCMYDRDDYLTLDEIIAALESSPFVSRSLGGKERLGFIGYDACMMGSMEMAYAMERYARYMVASEDVAWTNSWDYSFLGDPAITGDCETLVKRICEILKRNIRSGDALTMVYTLAAYDLDMAGEVANDLAILSDRLLLVCKKEPRKYAKLGRALSTKYEMGNWGSHNYESDLYDLKDFLNAADSIADSDWILNRVLYHLDQMIITHTYSPRAKNLCGVSIFFPLVNRDWFPEYLRIYRTMSEKYGLFNTYYTFIQKFADRGMTFHNSVYLAGTRQEGAVASASQKPSSYTFEIPLEGDLAESYVRSAYTVLARVDGDVYRLVQGGRGLEKTENDTLRVTIPTAAYAVRGSENQPWQEFSLVEAGRDEASGSVFYNVPVMLIHDLTVKSGCAMIWTDAQHPDGAFAALKPSMPSHQSTPAELATESGDILTFAHLVKRLTTDETGAVLPFSSWKAAEDGTVFFTETTIEDNSLQFSRQPLDPNTSYYVQLQVTDEFGTTYCTDLMPLG